MGAEEPPATPHRTLVMRSANGTSYRCFLPATETTDAREEGEGTSGSGTSLTQVGSGGELVPGMHGVLGHLRLLEAEQWHEPAGGSVRQPGQLSVYRCCCEEAAAAGAEELRS